MIEKTLDLILEGSKTKREIADRLGVSAMSAGKAVKLLADNDIIISDSKYGDVGRKSELWEISEARQILLIDLTADDLTYSLSPMSSDRIEVMKLEYNSSLDFTDNISLLLTHALKHSKPALTIVAVDDSYRSDNAGEDLENVFSRHGLSDVIFVELQKAVKLSENDVFIYIGKRIFGTFGRGRTEELSGVPVGGITYGESIRCALCGEKLTEYTVRFFEVINAVLNPRRILFTSELLPRSVKDAVSSRFDNVFTLDESPVFDGLMAKAVEETLKNILMK